MKLTPVADTDAARARRWKALVAGILPIVARHRRHHRWGTYLVAMPDLNFRPKPPPRAVYCPICGFVVGSDECSHRRAPW